VKICTHAELSRTLDDRAGQIVRHFRNELWFPQLLDRRYFQSWADDGRKDMAARCREMRDCILREHVPTPMDDDTLKAVDKLVADAKRHLSV
jgi:trimethylamine--corrinoid protein Co-methyltransferase